ncbi:MAG TPA: TonB-dependent receptor, partial [Chitinophagaceae bacterium]|nr:TonB-dependent receptor [Chitinophagaceae bacterium]
SYTKYEGEHYGKIIWASEGLTAIDSWYDLNALKNDLTLYLKQQTQLNEYWYLYYDLQFRNIKYNINGFRNNPGIKINNRFNFFNPKLGISYSKNNWKAYLSYSIANKEPNRDDFEAGTSQQPKPERLYDTEAGVERTGKKYSWSIGAYYMRYKDQLVLTGKINDVGAYTRTNIPDSYRAGVELQGAVALNQQFNITGNLTLSQNKINRFEEYIDDYDNGGQLKNNYSDVTIAYSPAVIGSAIINYLPVKKLEISLQNKYVSKQHLDNTENNNRVLDAFFVQDFRVDYRINKKLPKEINIIGQVNNILNVKYEPNGYTFSYIYGGSFITENYYFPMAGINFMLGLNLKF